MIALLSLNCAMIKIGPEKKGGENYMKLKQLEGFNFWERSVDYKSKYSAQSVTGCSSDEGGSQEDGGMDCSTDPSGN